MFTTIEDMLIRAEIDDSDEWAKLVSQPDSAGWSKIGRERMSSGELMPDFHFTGEEGKNDDGHRVAYDAGYFNMLQDYVGFIRQHCIPITWHRNAMLMWLPVGTRAHNWHKRHQHHLEGMSANRLVLKVVEAFPFHGRQHLRDRWDALDSLSQVRQALVNGGWQHDK